MADTIYVGNGKTGKYGIKINLCINDIAEYAKANIKAADNGKKYIRLDVNPRKEEDKYGNTHSVKVDTWVPESKSDTNAADTEPQKVKGNPYYDNLKDGLGGDDCPF